MSSERLYAHASAGSSSPIILCYFNSPTTSEIYTLSLHAALPIFENGGFAAAARPNEADEVAGRNGQVDVIQDHRPGDFVSFIDRKSTRLNSSHVRISYAVFCLKKKKRALIDVSWK